MRKGISPLIAAVLLIAFTMAVASLFAQWAPQLMEDAQADTAEQAADQQRCSQIIINIVDGDLDSATISQTNGQDPIGPIQVTWFYDGNDPIQDETSIGDAEGNRGTVVANHGQDTTGYELDYIRANPTECEGAPADEWDAE